MLSGVGMTDIIVGRALWDDLVRQIAVRARDSDDTADLPRTATPKRVRHRAQTPIDKVAIF